MLQQLRTHGIPGQLNAYRLDAESDITGCGKHNRLLVFKNNRSGEIEIREDDIGLPWSTEEDRQKVACETYQRMHPQGAPIVHQSSQWSDCGRHVWHFYAIDIGQFKH